MVMELMEGGELFELVRTKRRFTENEAVNFTKQVKLTQFQLLLKWWKFLIMCSWYLVYILHFLLLCNFEKMRSQK